MSDVTKAIIATLGTIIAIGGGWFLYQLDPLGAARILEVFLYVLGGLLLTVFIFLIWLFVIVSASGHSDRSCL
jgi:hypothetical protein